MSGDGYAFGATGPTPRITETTVDPRQPGERRAGAVRSGGHAAPAPRPAPRALVAPADVAPLLDPSTPAGRNAKFLIPFAMAALIAVQQLVAGPVVLSSALTCVVAVSTAALVWIVPNLERGVGQIFKAAAAVLGAGAQAGIALATNGIDPGEVITIALACLAAFGVGAVENAKAPPVAGAGRR